MKKFFFTAFFLISTIAFPQVSVNSTNPQGAFHVDGGRDNPVTGTPTSAQQANDFVVKPNGSVGIGTTSPDASALMEINTDHLTSKKGVLPPKVQLQSETDNSTITNPANGLVVYHTGATLQGKGLYINQGSPASPLWSSLVTKLPDFQSAQMKYAGEADPTKTVSAGNLEFRIAMAGTHVTFEMRMTNAPAADVVYFFNRLSWYNTDTYPYRAARGILTFTPSNWNQWQAYGNAQANLSLNMYAINTYLSSLQDTNFYDIKTFTRFGDLDLSNKLWNQTVNVY